MTKLLNSDEAFAMAIQIESNAFALYHRAAGAQRDVGTARLLEEPGGGDDALETSGRRRPGEQRP